MKIIHIAPFNIAGVPIALVQAEQKLGHYSRLVTLARDPRGYEEDMCLDLPFLDFWGTRLAKRLFSHPSKLKVTGRTKIPERTPITWQPNGFVEENLIALRERFWQPQVDKFFAAIDFWNFDVYQLDGGIEFFRDGRTVQRLKALGKKVICCYTGSDLRTRGVIPTIDACADINVTFEFDHLQLHPNIHHVFFPFDTTSYPYQPEENTEILRIGHAPTNRAAKGSARIMAAVRELQASFRIELVLIENVSHKEALAKKSQCHIFIDQISELGYGINSLESLAMGVATCSSLAPGFADQYRDHPFVVIDEHSIVPKLRELIQNDQLRQAKGRAGRRWVQQYHDSIQTVKRIHKLAGVARILQEEPA